MDVILFNDVCLNEEDKIIIYGQYSSKFSSITINPNINNKIIFSKESSDFYIEIYNKISYIKDITFKNEDNIEVKKKKIVLSFPFENCKLSLNRDSIIISTMCKDYSHRLEEWIEYNLKLGVSGIVIFDNDDNKNNPINEHNQYYYKIDNKNEYENNVSTSDICKKYIGKVHCVKFSYSPFKNRGYHHWNEIQRISFCIGVNAFRNKCGKIALIDADEFIYLPKHQSLIDFLSKYQGKTITMQSNILTNKSDSDIINNNILDLCIYVGESKYNKTIIDTQNIKPMEFIATPHSHPSQRFLDKEEIIHYHCWVNSRYKYHKEMPKIEFLKKK